MAYNLFLDDNFTPPQIADLHRTDTKDKTRYRTYRWVIVKTYDEFISTIKEKGLPDIVSFDHDLDPEHYDLIFNDENWNKKDEDIIIDYDIFINKTGYHAAEWLIEYCANVGVQLPICLVHSQNPVGRRNISNLLF
jgi:hypothetical protein